MTRAAGDFNVLKKIRGIGDLLRGKLEARFRLLTIIGRVLVPEYRFQWPFIDWFHDPEFSRFLDRFGVSHDCNDGRRWMLGQLLRLTAAVPGDTAECGVYRGADSYRICLFNASLPGAPRTHFMFDSFEGLSAPTAADGTHWKQGDLASPLEVAERALAEFPNTAFLPGWIPDRFAEVEDRSFSFVQADVDLYEPTRDSIAFFYPRLSPGGIFLCDDYGFDACPGATRAVDEFLRDKPEKAISLSDGGGFFIKGCVTR
jgi:O-methyltransferase